VVCDRGPRRTGNRHSYVMTKNEADYRCTRERWPRHPLPAMGRRV